MCVFFFRLLSPVFWPLFCQQFLRFQLCSLNSSTALMSRKSEKTAPPTGTRLIQPRPSNLTATKAKPSASGSADRLPYPCPSSVVLPPAPHHPLIENPLWQFQLFPLRFNSTARHFCFHYHFHCSSGVFKVLILRQYLLDFCFGFSFGFALKAFEMNFKAGG